MWCRLPRSADWGFLLGAVEFYFESFEVSIRILEYLIHCSRLILVSILPLFYAYAFILYERTVRREAWED